MFYIMKLILDFQINLRFVIFYIYLRCFLLAPQLIIDTATKNMSGIYENLASTTLKWSDIILIETMVAFVKEWMSIVLFNIEIWLAYYFFGDLECFGEKVFLYFVATILLSFGLNILVFMISVMRGLRANSVGILPFVGVLSAISILLGNNVTIILVPCISVCILLIWGLYKFCTWKYEDNCYL